MSVCGLVDFVACLDGVREIFHTLHNCLRGALPLHAYFDEDGTVIMKS